MREAAAATETYPTPNVQNADGAKVEKCFWKWWWSLSAWGQGPVWILVTCMQRHPLLFQFVVLWFFCFFLIYFTYYFFGCMVFRILVPQLGIDCAPCSPQLEKNPRHAATKTHCRDLPAGPVSKTTLPVPGVWCLVRELDPMCPN